MCERKAAGHVPAAAVAVVAGAALLGAVWAVLPGILLAAGITVVLLAAAGIAAFVLLERSHRPALSAAQGAALPGPSRLPVAGGARPAAISGRVVAGVVLDAAGNAKSAGSEDPAPSHLPRLP